LGVIGYNYGVSPSVATYTTGVYFVNTTTEIGFSPGGALPGTINPFITVGSYVKLSNYTATVGPNVNGVILLITIAPPIGEVGNYVGTPTTPLPTTGNGSAGTMTRFSMRLPDLRLASPIGFQAGTIAWASSGGSATTTITADNLPSHQHGLFQPGGRALGSVNGNLCGDFNVDANLRTIRGETYVEGSTESNGALVQNLPISTRNPYVAMNYIIKAET
jgi:microcystin-dependent protein